MRIAVDGEPLSEPETLVENLISPEGFDLYDEKFVVVEADSGEVKIIGTMGEQKTIAKIPAGTQAASDLQPPSQVFNGVTVDGDGNVYVPGETNRALYKISNPF